MKKMIFTLILMIITNVVSQELPVDSTTGRVQYSEVVNIESTSDTTLYARTLEWFATRFASSNDVIQLNVENEKIIGKGNFDITYYTRDPNIDFSISVLFKENRYKIIINGLSYSDNQGENFNIENFPRGWGGKRKLYTKIDAEIQSVLADLKNYVSTASVSEDDNW